MKLTPVLVGIGLGFGMSHFWRSKSLKPQPRNLDDVKGEDKSLKTMALETGSHIMQKFGPIQSIH